MLPLHPSSFSLPSTSTKFYISPSMSLHRRKPTSSTQQNSIKPPLSFRFPKTLFPKLKPHKANSCINSSSSCSPTATDNRELPEIGTLFRRFWKVAKPYWSSDDKVQARLQLAAVFALTLGTTGISVAFSYLGRDFYNALANFAKDTLSLRWRSWMTTYYMNRYLQNQSFYKIQSQSTIDNPDQRIVDDLSTFTGTALSFSLTLFNAAIDLISFSNILFGIYPPLFVVLLVYSIGGTAISIYLGKGLVTLNFLQEKKEADFRYGLVRVRENAESIAFYSGEENEMQMLVQRFRSAFQNLTRLLVASRNLDFFTSGYRYLIQILPAALVAPMYFSGKIEFGVINQSVSAFNHILGDVSLIIYQFQAISAFSAVIDRLGEFDDLLDNNSSENLTDSTANVSVVYQNVNATTNQTLLDSNGPLTAESCKKLVDLENLTLVTPEKATILMDLTLSIHEKDHLLIAGPSGSGKTSLLRAMAGLWTSGSGKITFYVKDSENFQPSTAHENTEESKPFKNRSSSGIFFYRRNHIWFWELCVSSCPPFLLCAEGSDGGAITRQPKPTDEELIKVLEDVRLGYLLPRFGLNSSCEWSSILSLGEQQRLAFARLLLAKPYLILLDESTSALDEDNEAHLYHLIEAAVKVLHITNSDPQFTKYNWTIKAINEEAKSTLSEIEL
ncbi:ABC transporter D family member 2 chloroplastic [Bienertia sinuspersici]